jgi:polysaccharide biosynthesis/export protein
MLLSGGQGMLKQIFLTGPIERRASGVLLGIILLACVGSLAACVTSLDDVRTAGPPEFQSGPSGAAQAEPVSGTFASATPADLQPGAAGSAPIVVPAAGRGTAKYGAAGSAPIAVPAASGGAAKYGYLVGATDVLQITVFKVPELTQSVQVADTGTINLPLLGEVPAAGKTAHEIEQDLTRQLGAKYLKNPQVTVFVKDRNSQTVTIEGAVMKPGVYLINGKLSLVQLTAMAGGLNNDLYDKDVKIFRMVNGERITRVFNIDDVRGGKAGDPVLRAGDVVVVDNSTGKTALNTALKVIAPAASLGAVAATVGD